MGFDKFFGGLVMLFVGVGLVFVLAAALEEVGSVSSSAVSGVVLLLAHGSIVLGLIGLVAGAWSHDRIPADVLTRYVLLILGGLLVINGNWGIAIAMAILSGALVWNQRRSRPDSEARNESPATDHGTADAPGEPPVE